MNIVITNTEQAKIDSENSIKIANEMSSVIGTMSFIQKEITNNWQGESTNDRDEILKELDNCIKFYNNKIIPALSMLGKGTLAYAMATEELANKGINQTPSQYAAECAPRADETINDQNSYTYGEKNFGILENKIGSLDARDERWDAVDNMFYYFKDKGLSDEQIAGVIGNAVGESGLIHDIKNPTSTAKGYFQWLDNRHPEDWSFETQMNHAWNEMQTRPDANGIPVIDHLSNQSTVGDATSSFAIYFEGSQQGLEAKKQYAQCVYSYIKTNL